MSASASGLSRARLNRMHDILAGYIDRRQGRWDKATHNMERAVELDPGNFFTLQQVALTYTVLRRYADAAATLDRAVALAPLVPGFASPLFMGARN